jgi:hypothetical protein
MADRAILCFWIMSSLRSVLVTLDREAGPDARRALLRELKSWPGVEDVGELQEDPDIPEMPTYFFVYVDPSADIYTVIDRLKHSPLVSAAEKPPLRTVAYR